MQRMMIERSQFSTFYYRIPNGESASDVYDRVSSFNESLWRSFAEPDFPSVCIIVTHGLTTRVFLMRWYRWTPEYFEDLRNIHHCEFLQMEQNEKGKFDLQTKMRTWSELHEANGTNPEDRPSSPSQVTFKWGGCSMGCDHASMRFPMMHMKRQETTVNLNKMEGPGVMPALRKSTSNAETQTNEQAREETAQGSNAVEEPNDDEEDDHPLGALESRAARMSISSYTSPKRAMSLKKLTSSTMLHPFEEHATNKARVINSSGNRSHAHSQRHPTRQLNENVKSTTIEAVRVEPDETALEDENLSIRTNPQNKHHHQAHFFLHTGRDGGGSYSGMGSPTVSDEDDVDPFDANTILTHEPLPISTSPTDPIKLEHTPSQPDIANDQADERTHARTGESTVEHQGLEKIVVEGQD
jgi:hypothetical protein